MEWSEPATSGGTPVTGYVMTYEESGAAEGSDDGLGNVGSEYVESDARSVNFTDVPSHVNLIVTVIAENAVGFAEDALASFTVAQ